MRLTQRSGAGGVGGRAWGEAASMACADAAMAAAAAARAACSAAFVASRLRRGLAPAVRDGGSVGVAPDCCQTALCVAANTQLWASVRAASAAMDALAATRKASNATFAAADVGAAPQLRRRRYPRASMPAPMHVRYELVARPAARLAASLAHPVAWDADLGCPRAGFTGECAGAASGGVAIAGVAVCESAEALWLLRGVERVRRLWRATTDTMACDMNESAAVVRAERAASAAACAAWPVASHRGQRRSSNSSRFCENETPRGGGRGRMMLKTCSAGAGGERCVFAAAPGTKARPRRTAGG